MSRPLTELQKAERAVKADLRKQKAELGPLFSEQAVAPDVQTVLVERRMGTARLINPVLDNIYIGDAITECVTRQLAEKHLGEHFAPLDDYRRRTYPPTPTYGLDFWRAALSSLRRVVYSWHRIESETGVRLIEDGVFPPDNWTPPFTREELPSTPPRCDRCRYWHPADSPCVEMSYRREAES